MQQPFNRYIYIYICKKIKLLFNSTKSILNRISFLIKRSLKLCYIGVFFKHSLRHSFTLIELSIALSVIGILSAVGISAYKASNPELKKDLKKMKAIEDKLQEFFNVNGRLPFPANPAENISNTNYLTEAIYRNGYNATR